MGMILRIASSRIVGQGDIVGRSGYFSLNLSANSVMRGRLDARRTLKSLVADLRDYYYPSRYNDFLNEAQRTFCRSIYRFKQGEIHGIEFFKACMTAIQADGKPYHIMFMPCSNWIKYEQRFKRLNWYMGKHRPDLTSGLYDTVICDARESLHEADGADSRVLERNYEITGDIKGKEIIIIDDVLTTGQSVSDYKEEIERHGGKVVAAIFYGKTFSMPPMSVVRMSVWGDSISHAIKGRKKS